MNSSRLVLALWSLALILALPTAQFMDGSGNSSGPVQDTISLDRHAPVPGNRALRLSHGDHGHQDF